MDWGRWIQQLCYWPYFPEYQNIVMELYPKRINNWMFLVILWMIDGCKYSLLFVNSRKSKDIVFLYELELKQKS